MNKLQLQFLILVHLAILLVELALPSITHTHYENLILQSLEIADMTLILSHQGQVSLKFKQSKVLYKAVHCSVH